MVASYSVELATFTIETMFKPKIGTAQSVSLDNWVGVESEDTANTISDGRILEDTEVAFFSPVSTP